METMRKHKWIFKVILGIATLAILVSALIPFLSALR